MDSSLSGGVGKPLLRRRVGGAGLPFVPGLVPLPRKLRMAWAPKLMRRVNGVVGAARPSSSSTAFSSIASELLVDMLPRRRPNEVALPLVGEEPESPTVETERRRRWSFMAAVVIGPGNALVPADVELLRWKRLVKAADVTEPRRGREPSGCELF